MNWFLYIVKEGFFLEEEITQRFIRPGQGIGRCDIGPGIIDAPHGIMYVVPGVYINSKIKRTGDHLSWPGYVADQISDLITGYYV